LHELINEGLLTLFFFLIGLEVKYEMVAGNLQTWDRLLHPAIAAIGGVVAPALIYIVFNMDNSDTQAGWAIPTATDIAFAVGILSLAGDKVPHIIKTLLVTIAIFDDLMAIMIIALFYSDPIVIQPLILAAAAVATMRILVHQGVTHYGAYVIPGLFLWLGILYTGIHATISGFIIGLCLPTVKIPSQGWNTKLLHKKLEPWVYYGVLPLFAFANAGVYVLDIDSADLVNPVSRGIMFGLLLGKPLGIGISSKLYLRLSKTPMPDVSSYAFYGMTFLCGIGFTMSLFIGGLAFGDGNPDYIKWVKIGVLRGSFLSSIAGLILLNLASKKQSLRRHNHGI
jgi:NhaA family Na+:H+ antiporter